MFNSQQTNKIFDPNEVQDFYMNKPIQRKLNYDASNPLQKAMSAIE